MIGTILVRLKQSRLIKGTIHKKKAIIAINGFLIKTSKLGENAAYNTNDRENKSWQETMPKTFLMKPTRTSVEKEASKEARLL